MKTDFKNYRKRNRENSKKTATGQSIGEEMHTVKVKSLGKMFITNKNVQVEKGTGPIDGKKCGGKKVNTKMGQKF